MRNHVVSLAALICAVTLSALAFQQETFTFRVVTSGLQNPWEIAWGADDHLWVTERVGKRITRVRPTDGTKAVAVTIDEVVQAHGQDGLLGLALHPGLLRGTGNDYVYAAYTYDSDSGPEMARRGKVRRYTYNPASGTLSNPMDLISSLPAGNDHVAFRLTMGPDQKLYLSIGDQGANFLQTYCIPNLAQELPAAADVKAQNWTRYQGKILRLNLDGTIPSDNPVLQGVRSHIFSYGHRNPQGLAFGSNGKLYASEHGPDTDDEFNLIESGKNYGWPHVAGYNDDRVYVYARWSSASPTPCNTLKFSSTAVHADVPVSRESTWSHPDFRPPLRTFFTVASDYSIAKSGSATIAPAGMDFFGGTAIPGWTNSALLLSLKFGTVYRLRLAADGNSVAGDTIEQFKTTNRYRDIAIHPDGRTIFLATDNTGSSTDDSGRQTRTLANPGSIIAFTLDPSGTVR